MRPKDLEFGLLGERLGHSFSPAIHRQLAGYDYQLVELPPEEVEPFLRTGRFRGLNVTIPYKKTVMACCDALSPAAERIGSVNTLLRRPDGTLYGDNTDYDGFRYLLQAAGAQVERRRWCWVPAEPPLPSTRCWPIWAPGRQWASPAMAQTTMKIWTATPTRSSLSMLPQLGCTPMLGCLRWIWSSSPTVKVYLI